uniref:Cyclin N-terminal domain-containing protein n=1 Tax=Macrostomum lignano TaxID=282301 RepID=A0A1I8FJ15_9PLAT
AGLDTWAVAQAYVFFEKLALKGFVNKLNRRHSCAVSLVLSAKLNDIKGPDLTELESAFRLSRREILSQEMAALLGLEFSFAVPDYEVLSHQQRIVSGLIWQQAIDYWPGVNFACYDRGAYGSL